MKRTNIVLDEKLAHRALRMTGLKTYRELVDHALRELIRRADLANKIKSLKGKIRWEGNLNQMRRGRLFEGPGRFSRLD
jgi:Arc/MetJ family transcription regulator